MTDEELNELVKQDIPREYDPEDRRKAGLPIKPLKDSSVRTSRKQSNKDDIEDCLEIRQRDEEDTYLYSMLAAKLYDSLDDSSSSSACNNYDSSFDSSFDCSSDY